MLATPLGRADGRPDGCTLGTILGAIDGLNDGAMLGYTVGIMVGIVDVGSAVRTFTTVAAVASVLHEPHGLTRYETPGQIAAAPHVLIQLIQSTILVPHLNTRHN